MQQRADSSRSAGSDAALAFVVGGLLAALLARQYGQLAPWSAPADLAIPVLALLFSLGAVQSFWADVDTGRPSLMLIGGLFAAAGRSGICVAPLATHLFW